MQAIASEAGKKLLSDPYQAAQIPTKYISGYIDGLKGTFEGSWSVKDRTRSLQLTFVNLTDKDILLEDTFFDSGTWFQSWSPEIKAGMVQQGTVANSQGSVMTGVTGGMRLKIKDTQTYIYLGFTNPFTGSYKHYVELNKDWKQARHGYDNSQNNNPKIQEADGYKIQCVQTESSIAQMAFVYEICKAWY